MNIKWPDFKFPAINLWIVPKNAVLQEWYMSDGMSEQWYTEVYLKQQEEDAARSSTWNTVKQDIDEREKMGVLKYGKYLTPNTDEDMLQHAYEEALDLTVYLKTLLNQRKKDG